MKDLTYKERVLKDFDDRFGPQLFDPKEQEAALATFVDLHQPYKAFISQALDGQVEELRKKVAALKRPEALPNGAPAPVMQYNNAIDDALTLIPSPSKK